MLPNPYLGLKANLLVDVILFSYKTRDYSWIYA